MTSRRVWGGTASQQRDAVESRSRRRAARLVLAVSLTSFLTAIAVGFGAATAMASPAADAVSAAESTVTASSAGTAAATAAQDDPTAPPSEESPAPAPSAPPPSDEATTPPADDPTTPPPAPEQPRILSPADGAFVSSPVTLSGTGTPGGSLQILAAGASEPFCIVTPDPAGEWTCTADGLPSSPGTSIRAVELGAGGESVQDSVTLRILNAPVVTGGPRGTLTNAVVQGSAVPGGVVTATASGYSCSGTADASGAWSCALGGGITDGDYVVTATQTTSWSGGAASPASEPLGIQVDVTVPAAPHLTSPRSGQVLPLGGATFTGSGEDGATVSVFAGAYSLCQVLVSGTSWSCSAAAVPAGNYPVAVLQQDPAGNVSVQSGPLTLVFQDATATAPGTPSTGAPGTTPGAPGSSAGSPDASTPADGGSSGPGGSGSGGSGSDGLGSTPGGDSGGPAAPGDAVPPAGALPPAGTWSDATRFTASLQPVLGGGAGAVWWVALAVGALALLLVALPARLLAGTVETVAARDAAGSPRARRLSALLGRNRSRHEYDRAPELRVHPRVTTAAAVLAAAAIVTLSGPVQSQPAYLRLFVAVVLALALVNAVATVVPSAVARIAFGIRSVTRIRPGLLLVSAALAVVSRLADLEPTLVFGLVAGLVVADAAGSVPAAAAAERRGASRHAEAAATADGTAFQRDSAHPANGHATADARAAEGRLAIVQVLALGVLGAVAWLVSGWLGDQAASGDLMLAAVAEFLHVVVLASFGASSLLLVPIGRSTGRRLLRWSPATWLLLTVSSFSALAMLFLPALTTAVADGRAVALLIAAVAFAAVSVSAWAWTTFVADAESDGP